MRLVVPTSRSAAPERCHDLRDAEAIADLDQLAARDDRFAARGQLVQNQKERRGAVVDRDGGLAENGFEQRPDMHIALAAAAGREIVFEIAVAGDGLEWRQRRASEVGVENDAGGIDRRAAGTGAAMAASAVSTVASIDRLGDVAAFQDFRARAIEGAADLVNDELMRKAAGGRPKTFEHFMDGRQVAWSHAPDGIELCRDDRNPLHWKIRGVAQPGRAPGSGPGGRWFESTRPDHFISFPFN